MDVLPSDTVNVISAALSFCLVVGCRFPQDTRHSQPTPWST